MIEELTKIKHRIDAIVAACGDVDDVLRALTDLDSVVRDAHAEVHMDWAYEHWSDLARACVQRAGQFVGATILMPSGVVIMEHQGRVQKYYAVSVGTHGAQIAMAKITD